MITCQKQPVGISAGSLVVVVASLTLLFLAVPVAGACGDGERDALLTFLDALSPRAGDNIAASWRGSADCCAWEGVGCDDAGGGGAVTSVSLPGRGLGGTISPAVARLPALARLNLSGNGLAGPFPAELLALPNASVVDVSYNRLSGALPDAPAAVGRARLPLRVLDVSSNHLSGRFPSVLWRLTPGLVSLNASNNSFAGAIPSLCVICPAVAVLDVSLNAFGGPVPPGFGNCSRLRVLSAGRNNLTGELPDDLFDLTSLEQLALPSNRIQGRLDRLRIARLINLVKLDLTYNALTGGLPESIGELTMLEELRLGKNNLTGTIPPVIGNWTSLRYLDLRSNNFVGDLGAVDFSRLANLAVLDLASNNLTGAMPPSIYSCTSMTALRVANNEITGQVPPEIGDMRELQFLSLTVNNFTNISGMFWNLQGCKDLATLLVSYNFYGEALPDAGWVGDHVSSVRLIVMEECGLTGQIPSWLSKLQGLNVLNLAGNRLTGPIPSWLGAMKRLYYVDLSGNHFAGEIPPSLMELPLLASEKAMAEFNPGPLPLVFTLTPNNGAAVRTGRAYYQMSGVSATLNLSDNNFSGAIPREVGQMKTLQVLDLSYNNLSGGIPPELSGVAQIEILDLRQNRLTGSIPPALAKLHFLSDFNVEHNDLEGPIPTGGQFNAFPAANFAGNPKLCGQAISVRCGKKSGTATGKSSPSKTMGKRVLVAIVLGVCFGVVAVVVLAGLAVIAIRRFITNGSVSDGGKCAESALFDYSMSDLHGDESKDTILFMSEELGGGDPARKSVTFVDILKATNNFSPDQIIGTGGYGLVFLAELEGGVRLAVKKLNGDMCLVEREFRAEVEALSVTRHENLVPLQGFCIRGRLRLLLYPYMANGSLHDWLHDRRPEQPELDWRARLRIARGAGRGVLHIHEACTPQIVHRDIKSSNILLDESGEARVADFGLARLILPDRTHVTTELVGTLGYIPPEYGQGWVATLRGDVYSFGVVLLELLTGRRPVEMMAAAGQPRDLVGRVTQMRSAGRHAEALDPRLRQGCRPGDEAQMLYVLDLACLCVDAIPLSRPAIQEVVSWLDNVDTIGAS
ncbi:hypothetical protein ACQJBY_070037 [Aegilops geniculata]